MIILKYFVKKYLDKKDYNDIFIKDPADKEKNYVAYSKHYSNKDSKRKNCTQEEFYKFLENYLDKIKEKIDNQEDLGGDKFCFQ